MFAGWNLQVLKKASFCTEHASPMLAGMLMFVPLIGNLVLTQEKLRRSEVCGQLLAPIRRGVCSGEPGQQGRPASADRLRVLERRLVV